MTRPAAQTGMALIFALLALLALSLGAVALLHSVDTGTRVLGNLGFKQEVTNATDRATQMAVEWLAKHSSTATDANYLLTKLDADDDSQGYHATANGDAVASSAVQVDPTGQRSDLQTARRLIKWGGSSDTCLYATGDTTGLCTLAAKEVVTANGSTEPITLRYAIFRLCAQPLSPTNAGNTCSRPINADSGTASEKGQLDYAKPSPLTGVSNAIYYRILVQATDARNTTTVTESIVQY